MDVDVHRARNIRAGHIPLPPDALPTVSSLRLSLYKRQLRDIQSLLVLDMCHYSPSCVSRSLTAFSCLNQSLFSAFSFVFSRLFNGFRPAGLSFNLLRSYFDP
jgi:hypothetical protein